MDQRAPVVVDQLDKVRTKQHHSPRVELTSRTLTEPSMSIFDMKHCTLSSFDHVDC